MKRSSKHATTIHILSPTRPTQLYVEITELTGVKYINTKSQHSITQILTLLPAWGFLNTKIGGRKPPRPLRTTSARIRNSSYKSLTLSAGTLPLFRGWLLIPSLTDSLTLQKNIAVHLSHAKSISTKFTKIPVILEICNHDIVIRHMNTSKAGNSPFWVVLISIFARCPGINAVMYALTSYIQISSFTSQDH